MSEFHCDCSVDLTWDDVNPQFCHVKDVKARKEHVCIECGAAIPPGQTYERVRGLWDGYFGEYKTCLTCTWIRRDYCPNGWYYGQLRERLMECIGIDYVSGRVASWVEDEDDD